MKNLIVNGCSFTQDFSNQNTWASFLNEKISPKNYVNLAQAGAGNKFISDSTISFLESFSIPKKDTFIIIMWSGVGRKDLHISKNWFFYLKKKYDWLCQKQNESYYLHSGGLTLWSEYKDTKKIFQEMFKVGDPISTCIENLIFFIQLENYLIQKGYNFVFTNYLNTWNTEAELTLGGDYCIGYYCKNMPMYKNFSFKNWIFADDKDLCLGEFANHLDNLVEYHPTEYAHSKFANILYSKLFI